jgi:CHASE2 domain-containing sensor protein
MSNLSPFTKVLFLEANPETKTHLRINKEIREVKQSLRDFRHHGRIEINQLGAVRTEDFTAELFNYKPRIVHFSGHGVESIEPVHPEDLDDPNQVGGNRGTSTKSKDKRKKADCVNGGIIFEAEVFVYEDENQDNKEERQANGAGKNKEKSKDKNITKIVHRIVTPDEVANFFKGLKAPVECVVLNGCHTEETARKVNERVRFVIGMSDEIPDQDAVNFSKFFYQALGAGSSIKSAFEKAKEQIFNPSLPVFLENKEVRPLPRYEPRWILASSLASALFIILFRLWGGLQGLEIGFFDYLQTFWLRERDDRILIVHATNEDVRFQQQQGEQVTGSFSSQTLGRLLSEISALEPAAIGLDIYRENELDPTLPEERILQNHFRQDNIFGVCLLPDIQAGGQGRERRAVVQAVPPPPDISGERIGFSDISVDRDVVVRRQLLGGFTDSLRRREDCNTNESFSLKLANNYLESRNVKAITLDSSGDQICKIYLPNGKTLESLHPFTGGYQFDTRIIGGCQVLLRYRINRDGQDNDTWRPAEMFTVQEVLNGELESKDVKDKLVFIGVTRTDGYREYWNTPYNVRMGNQMSGVMLQAQMTSQLLDAALGKASLIWVLPFWGEWLWILLWSSVGGVIVWQFQRAATRVGALVIAGGVSYAICLIGFQAASGWLPFVPVALVLIAAPFSSWLVDLSRINFYKTRRN